MDAIFRFLTIIAIIIVLAGLFMSTSTQWRKSGWVLSLVSFAALLCIGFYSFQANQNKWKELGFVNITDYQEAKKKNITDPKQWEEYKTRREVEYLEDSERILKQLDESIKKDEEFLKEFYICAADLSCAANSHANDASYECSRSIQELVKYKYRWTNSSVESRFPRAIWKDKEKFILTYIGDKLQLKTEIGAWQTYTYICDYNFFSDEVINVSITPDRM